MISLNNSCDKGCLQSSINNSDLARISHDRVSTKHFKMENVKHILLGTVLLLVTLCEAHICLFNPRQRGTMNGINAAGEAGTVKVSILS